MTKKQEAVEALAKCFERAGVKMSGAAYAEVEEAVTALIEANWAAGVQALRDQSI